MKFSSVFGNWLCSQVENGENNLIAITPAMSEGSGMNEFSEKYPNNFFDVAIAEQHSMTFAAGLAKEGKKPVLPYIQHFATRLRSVIHDVALQNLDVTIAIDRLALGGDGATHAGILM